MKTENTYFLNIKSSIYQGFVIQEHFVKDYDKKNLRALGLLRLSNRRYIGVSEIFFSDFTHLIKRLNAFYSTFTDQKYIKMF